MTDNILRARQAWCEPVPGGRDPLVGGLIPAYRICPPEVVAALLDVLERYRDTDDGYHSWVCCGVRCYTPHADDCPLGQAEAAITRALEGK